MENNIYYNNYNESLKVLGKSLSEIIIDIRDGENGKNKILKWHVKEGDFVSKDDTMVAVWEDNPKTLFGGDGINEHTLRPHFPGKIYKIIVKEGEEFINEKVICQIIYTRKFPQHNIKLNLLEKIISYYEYDQINWFVSEGDSVAFNQNIAEASNKKELEGLGLNDGIIKSPILGTINEIFFKSDEKIPEGSVLATVKYKYIEIIDWETWFPKYINKGDKMLVVEKIMDDEGLGLGNPQVAVTSRHSGILIEKKCKKGDKISPEDIIGVLI